MTGPEAIRSVQFVTLRGQRLAVLSADDWEALVEWLESLEDAEIAHEALSELAAAGGDRERAGWRRWDEASQELE